MWCVHPSPAIANVQMNIIQILPTEKTFAYNNGYLYSRRHLLITFLIDSINNLILLGILLPFLLFSSQKKPIGCVAMLLVIKNSFEKTSFFWCFL